MLVEICTNGRAWMREGRELATAWVYHNNTSSWLY